MPSTATITAKNVGDKSEPMSIGWHPYFTIPSGDRTQARLHIPAEPSWRWSTTMTTSSPPASWCLSKARNTTSTRPMAKPLDDMFLDDNFSKLT